jgi:hypothetical protein
LVLVTVAGVVVVGTIAGALPEPDDPEEDVPDVDDVDVAGVAVKTNGTLTDPAEADVVALDELAEPEPDAPADPPTAAEPVDVTLEFPTPGCTAGTIRSECLIAWWTAFAAFTWWTALWTATCAFA